MTEARRESLWNVLDFGAIADGEADNTVAFQQALDAAGKAHGGVVFAPTGRYSFAGSLRVPKDVTLQGVFAWAPSHSGIRDKNDELPRFGTVLLPRGGAGSEEGPAFIQLDTNSVLQGVCVYYPDQIFEPPPIPYPYAISMRGSNPAVIDVELLNPYNGIDVGRGGRQYVRNVYGQPLHIGLFVDESYDCCRLENVHWNPWWTYQSPMSKWQLDNGVGFIFGRSDGQYALNTFCFNYDVGYKFTRTNAGVTYGNFAGSNAELCHACVYVEDCCTWGILISNGGYALLDPPRSMMVRVAPQNRGTVRFSNCAFWGPTDRCALVEGADIALVSFSDCTFGEWPEDRSVPREERWKRDPAIAALGGSVMVRGCEFRDHKPQIYLGPELRGAIITDNIMHWPIDVRSDTKTEVIIANNLALPASRDQEEGQAPPPPSTVANAVRARQSQEDPVQRLYVMPGIPVETRWYTFENPKGLKGGGGTANFGRKGSPFVAVPAGKTVVLADIEGSGTIRRIWATLFKRDPHTLRGMKIEAYWDGASTPAVQAPLGDFFCHSLGQMSAFENACFSSPDGRTFNCCVPMPFRDNARIVLINESSIDNYLYYDVDCTQGDSHGADMLYFHAHWRRENFTTLREDMTILPRVSGRGRFLGCNLGVCLNPATANYWWGEGEVKIYLDGDTTNPTLCGTGTEDYTGCAYGLKPNSHRNQGCHFISENQEAFGFYRLHLPDPVYFWKDIRVTIQVIGGPRYSQMLQALDKDPSLRFMKTGDGTEYYTREELEAGPEKDGLVERVDDYSATAYWYMDKPKNDLVPIAPVAERIKDLPKERNK